MCKTLDPLVLYLYFRGSSAIKSYADSIGRIPCRAHPERTIMRTFYFCDFCSYNEKCTWMRELQRALIREYNRVKESE